MPARTFVGAVGLDRREADRPGQLVDAGPGAGSLLRATTNRPSIALLQRLEFTEVDRFVEFGREQSLWIRELGRNEGLGVLTLTR